MTMGCRRRDEQQVTWCGSVGIVGALAVNAREIIDVPYPHPANLAIGFFYRWAKLAGVQVTGSFIDVDHDAVRGRLEALEGKGARNGAITEEALAAAHDRRENDHVELIDEVAAQQGLDQLAAAGDLNLTAVLLLELCNLADDLLAELVRVRPLKSQRRPRGNVLRDPVVDCRDRIIARHVGPRGGEADVRLAAQQQRS